MYCLLSDKELYNNALQGKIDVLLLTKFFRSKIPSQLALNTYILIINM